MFRGVWAMPRADRLVLLAAVSETQCPLTWGRLNSRLVLAKTEHITYMWLFLGTYSISLIKISKVAMTPKWLRTPGSGF